MGYIGIHNVLNYKRFQQLVSQKTGYLASQTSAVLVCRRQVGDVGKRQKLPINENTNFNIILSQHNPMRERDVHFLVTLKKSKKERKQANRKKAEEEEAEEEAAADALAASSLAPSDAAMRERERISSALGALNPGALKGRDGQGEGERGPGLQLWPGRADRGAGPSEERGGAAGGQRPGGLGGAAARGAAARDGPPAEPLRGECGTAVQACERVRRTVR